MSNQALLKLPSKVVHKICATIEFKDGSVEFKWWRGNSVAAIKKAVLENYPEAVDIQFGNDWPEFFYGAH